MKKGNVKLYCGDCLEVMKKIPDKSIDLVLTDPPYGMGFKSNYRKIKYEKIENDDNLSFIKNFINESYRILKDNSHFYCFCSWHKIESFKVSIQKLFTIKNILVWEKNNTSMGDLYGSYAPKYEFIIFAVKGKRKLYNGRQPDIIRFNRTGNKLHPTQKPIDLLEYVVKKSSDECDVIVDPFMGSGSTGVACVNTNRKFIGIEKDEKYFEIAKNRIEAAI